MGASFQATLFTDKAVDILSPVESEARQWIERGAHYVAVGSGLALLARGSEALAAKYNA